MSSKSCFTFLLLAFAFLFLDAPTASACSCAPRATVLDAYEGANVVIIARALSVERIGKEEDYRGIRSTKMVVEKVFKGNLRVGDEMIFAQGGGADCIWTFDEKDIDNQYLFYLRPMGKNANIWIAGTCGRSRNLEYAMDDLLYLNNLNKVRGKTRISGTIYFDGDNEPDAKGIKIRINGEKKSYEVKTDENGVYEIYDLPAGKYFVEPEVPFGWKVGRFWLSRSRSFAGNEETMSLKKIPIILEEKKHAALDLHFEMNTAIRGKIYDTNGKPIKGVCITALQTQREKGGPFDCTDENGNFEITTLPLGSYVLVVNDDGKISNREPFKTFYYPNVFEREKATVITIGVGDIREGVYLYIPKMEETVTIEGVFLYSDGKPVAKESVEFASDKTADNIEGDAQADTDENGRFSIKVLKGLKGKLHGEMYTYIGELENCPKLESIIKKSGRDFMEVKTPEVEVQAENNLYEVELKYPFPSCKKAQEAPK